MQRLWNFMAIHGPSHHESKFEIESAPASLHRLGNRLKAWNPLEEKDFLWKPNE